MYWGDHGFWRPGFKSLTKWSWLFPLITLNLGFLTGKTSLVIHTCQDVRRGIYSACGSSVWIPVGTQHMTASISFVGWCHRCCSKVRVSDSSIKAAFISQRDFIFNNANLLATDRLAVLVDLMGWAVLICEPGFYLLAGQKFAVLFMYTGFHGLNLQI